MRTRRPVLRFVRWKTLEEQHYLTGLLDRRRGRPCRSEQSLGCNEAAYLDGYRDGKRLPRVAPPSISRFLESFCLQKEAA